MSKNKKSRRGWGCIRQLKSNNTYQASYIGVDKKRHYAPITFKFKKDAESFLTKIRDDIEAGIWNSSINSKNIISLKTYSEKIIHLRELKANTQILYLETLKKYVYNHKIATMDIRIIKALDIKDWFYTLDPSKNATRQKAIQIMKLIFNSAIDDEIIDTNPVKIKVNYIVQNIVKVASPDEIKIIINNMPEKYKLLVELSVFLSLRIGETLGIKLKDFDFNKNILSIKRAVVFIKGKSQITTPKTKYSIRDISIPPHIILDIKKYIKFYNIKHSDDLIFYSKNNTPIGKKVIIKYYKRATKVANRPDLRFHDLRHTGATYAALSGASIKELMDRLGHSTPAMAIHYQHILSNRPKEIADNMSEYFLSGKVK
jgi:integrase